ncbi:hypothetical protein DFQ30_010466, partial [Apophysomyces sp. BC1015]
GIGIVGESHGNIIHPRLAPDQGVMSLDMMLDNPRGEDLRRMWETERRRIEMHTPPSTTPPARRRLQTRASLQEGRDAQAMPRGQVHRRPEGDNEAAQIRRPHISRPALRTPADPIAARTTFRWPVQEVDAIWLLQQFLDENFPN